MASLVERLELLITANAKGAVAGLKETELAANGLDKQTTTLGRTMANFGTYAKVGAGLAAAGIAAMAFEGIKHFVELTAQVRAYQRILGGSAEENSKVAASMRMLGIDSEAAIKAFGFLAKTIGNNNDTLGQWGVTVARNLDGNINLQRTLLRIGDTYKGIVDPTQRAAFAAQNFGRGYQTLIPYLSKSREELKAFGEEADKNHEVFTQEQLDQGKEFSLAMRENKAALNGLAIALGQDLVPVVTEFFNILTDGIHILDSFGRAIGFSQTSLVALGTAIGFATGGLQGGLIGGLAALAAVAISTKEGFQTSASGIAAWGVALNNLSTAKAAEQFQKIQDKLEAVPSYFDAVNGRMQVFKALADENPLAAQKIIDGLEASGVSTDKYVGVLERSIAKRQEEAQAAQDQAEQNENLVATLDDVQSALLRVSGGQLGYEQSLVDLNKAQTELATVIKETPGDWNAIHEAQLKVDQANLNVAKSALDLSTAQETLGGTFAGGTKAAEEELARLKQLQIDNPRAAASIQPLIDKLNEYIGFVKSVPDEKKTFIALDGTEYANKQVADYLWNLSHIPGRVVTSIIAQTIAANPEAFFQHGGPVPGGTYDPYPAVLHGGEYVLSADVVDRIKQGRQSRGARPPQGGDWWPGGGSSGGPIVIRNVVELDGRVVAESTASHLARTGGPQIPQRAIAN